MPVLTTDTAGTTTTTSVPSGYSSPTPVEEFRWDEDGILKWEKSAEDIMTGGSYVIQSSDDSGATWDDLTTVTQASISTDTGTYRDTTGSEGRLYQIKKLTSAAYGSKSSIYVGEGAFFEATTDKCYVMVYARDMKGNVLDNAFLKVDFSVSSGVTYVTYKNQTIVPVKQMSVSVEDNSGLFIIPLIPSAHVTSGGSAVQYTFTIVQSNQEKISLGTKTVPTAASAFFLDL